MSLKNKSNEIKAVFEKEIGLKLYQRVNSSLVAMNHMSNGPYKLAPDLKGVNVGISFKHHKEGAVEVYFTNAFYNSENANSTFDTVSNYFKGASVTTTVKVDGTYHPFSLPISQLNSIEDACSVLEDICLGLKGTVRV